MRGKIIGTKAQKSELRRHSAAAHSPEHAKRKREGGMAAGEVKG